ncbi:MAG: hypothetical protein K2H17_03935 [Duncaniella sp.]|uniref:hypothetical protein n=1 Tax=Duncaniella sp. TaxID=2518496 RepID=UPI0023BC5B3E|nr:hypothetical protein [Duncaniella sp.]MDE5988529.1 hypothetical protein [Duncaniella sp.]
MEEALSHYLRALADPEVPVSISDVERLLKEYPFFTLPALTLIRREGSSLPADTRRRLMDSLALNASDPAALAMMTDPRSETWLNFYPPEQTPEVTTENAIDTFLATYGHSTPEEDALLERLIFNPTADYSMMLAREEEASLPPEPSPADSSQDALINAFILKNKSPRPDTAAEEEPQTKAPTPVMQPEDHPVAVRDTADDSSLSESLAKIYIRRRRYDKAFEIIHNLSLKNPKKSVYFADQLRFLQKLMINSRYNNS